MKITEDGPLAVCVLMSTGTEGGPLVVVRECIDARVYLGAVVDRAGTVHRWVEVWVQSHEGLENTPAAYREQLSNALLDRRWMQAVEGVSEVEPRQAVRVGFEEKSPGALYIDPVEGELIRPRVQGTSHTLELCTDDALLREVGLPAYSTTLARYLWAPALGLESPFVPATGQSPNVGATVSFEEATGETRELVALNPGAGLMAVRTFAPLTYEQYVDGLGGANWPGIPHGRAPIPFGEGGPQEDEHEGGIFLGRHGRWGRVIEGLHLKLRAFASAVAAVEAFTHRVQRPLLNVSAESFRAHVPEGSVGLPAYWAARVELAAPGEAVELPLATADATYYVASNLGVGGVYRPDFGHAATRGRASVRIRKTFENAGAVSIEGTFATQERLSSSRNDLVALTLGLGGERIEVFGRLESEKALAAGEWRFRSLEQRLHEKAAAALKASEGVLLNEAPFEVIPLLSSPCDLYALGVLGVRTFVVNSQTTLAVALDEMLSLARQVAAGAGGELPLADRVGAVLASDPRWMQSLGPQRLVHESLTPEQALSIVPAELWREVLALLVTMFPGVGPDSACRDFGDARAGGLHTVYEAALTQLKLLLVRTRSLILIDWGYNREVNGVIRRMMAGLGGSGPVSAGPKPSMTGAPPTIQQSRETLRRVPNG